MINEEAKDHNQADESENEELKDHYGTNQDASGHFSKLKMQPIFNIRKISGGFSADLLSLAPTSSVYAHER